MLNVARALMRSRQDGGREFPRVAEFQDLYDLGWMPRYGEMTGIVARSASGKSTFALFYALKSGLRTLYCSGDMSAFQASVKLACATHHTDIDTVVDLLRGERREEILLSLPTHIDLSFGEITFAGIDRMLDAYVELHNEYPELIVIDNLMDIEGCANEYDAQTRAIQYLHNLNRETGIAFWVMIHATDKGDRGKNSPFEPAPRNETKNGLSEKFETMLSMAINPHTQELHVALVKNRLGKSDPSGRQYASVTAILSESRYLAKGQINVGGGMTSARRLENKIADKRPEQASGSTVRDGVSEATEESRIRRGTFTLVR